jgi:hypothetical protein
MSQKTEPVFKLVLSVGLIGVFVTMLGIIDRRDILALGGMILIASSLHAIARLVK